MIHENLYPVLEYDDDLEALIDPFRSTEQLPSDRLVISFFSEAIQTLLSEGEIELYTTLAGENPIAVYRFICDNVLLIHGRVGCPATAGALDLLVGMGGRRAMFCGGGGALERGIHVGQLFVVQGAIRDEGFSYHYIKPSRIIYAQSDVRQHICDYLRSHNIPHTEGLCWTTDAIYRETRSLIQYRNREGAKIVEMEQAGCIAVAQFRNIKYGAILYGGDDVSKDTWDKRAEISRKGVRYSLIQLCRDIVNTL